MLGLLLGSLLAGALTNILEFEPQELTMMKILEREQARQMEKALALSKLKARLTTYVIRFRARRAANANTLTEFVPNRAQNMSTRLYSDAMELTGRLRKLQQVLRKDSNDFLSDAFKVDRLYNRVKFVSGRVKSICHQLNDTDVLNNCLGRRIRETFPMGRTSENPERVRSVSAGQGLVWDNERKRYYLRRGNKNDASLVDVAIPKNLLDNAQRVKIALKLHIRSAKAGVAADADKGATTTMAKAAKTFSWVEGKAKEEDATAIRGKLTAPVEHMTEEHRTEKSKTEGIINLLDDGSFTRSNWRKDKMQILARWHRARKFAAVVGILGSMSALCQHEMIVSGNGSRTSLNILKAFNTMCSIMCVAAVIRIYWLNDIWNRLLDHVHKFASHIEEDRLWHVLLNKTLWLELIVVFAHCPPGLETSMSSRFLQNFVAYRIETVMSCWNMFRVYLVWRTIEDAVLSDLTAKKHTLAGFNRVELSGSFVVKRMLHSHMGFVYLCILWSASIMWFGCWFRCAENTACQYPDIGLDPIAGCETREARVWVLYGSEMEKRNDTLLQNAVWLMFVTATSVGYGEVNTTTHAGRAICSAMGLVGLMLVAILTASLGQNLQWTKSENTTKKLVDREVKRAYALHLAVRIIQRWWRHARASKGSRLRWCFPWQPKERLGDLRTELMTCKRDLAVPIDDASGK